MVAKRRSSVPTPSLSREAIIVQAMEVMRVEGLSALTMRRVAGACGVQSPTLYWHFRDKNEMLAGMVDMAIGMVELGDPGVEWDDRICAIARSYRQVLKANGGIAELMSLPLRLSDNIGRFTDTWIGVLVDVGFDLESAAQAFFTVNTFVLGFVTYEVDPLFGGRSAAPGMAETDELSATTSALLDRYPRLLSLATVDTTGDATFDFGLGRMVDGLRSYRAALR